MGHVRRARKLQKGSVTASKMRHDHGVDWKMNVGHEVITTMRQFAGALNPQLSWMSSSASAQVPSMRSAVAHSAVAVTIGMSLLVIILRCVTAGATASNLGWRAGD